MLTPIHCQGRPAGSDPPVTGNTMGGIGVAVGVGSATGVSVGKGVGSSVACKVTGVFVAVGISGVAVGVSGVAVGVGVSVSVAVGVGVSVTVAVGVGVSVSVAVGIGVSVGVGVGVDVSVGVAVGVSVGMFNDGAASTCIGRPNTTPTRQKRARVDNAIRRLVEIRFIVFLLQYGVDVEDRIEELSVQYY
jgi:hypothetical protein